MPPFLFSTILLDPPTALLLGGILALANLRRKETAGAREIEKMATWGAWAGALYALSVAWFFFRYPDWMFVYLLDTREVPLTLAFALFFLVLVAFGSAGAISVYAFVVREKKAAAVALLLAFFANCLAIFYCQRDAYTHLGTFAEYHEHTAKPLSESASMSLALPLTTGLILAWMLVLLLWRRRTTRTNLPHQPRAVR